MNGTTKKRLYVIGTGPGKTSGMTGEALSALEESDVIAGYPVYLELLPEKLKEILAQLHDHKRKETDSTTGDGV